MNEVLIHNLSIYMVVKDAEWILEKTLQQARKLTHTIIVVVDADSSDNSEKIATEFSAEIHVKKWMGYSRQKEYAKSKCKTEWAFSLDADEVLSDELVEEIRKYFMQDLHDIKGFHVPRILFIGDRPVKSAGFFPDYQLRIFRKQQAKYRNTVVHETVELLEEGRVIQLSHMIMHYSTRSIADFQTKTHHYAVLFNNSLDCSQKGYGKAIVKATFNIFRRLVIQRGIIGGKLGIEASIVMFKYTYWKYVPGLEKKSVPKRKKVAALLKDIVRV